MHTRIYILYVVRSKTIYSMHNFVKQVLCFIINYHCYLNNETVFKRNKPLFIVSHTIIFIKL